MPGSLAAAERAAAEQPNPSPRETVTGIGGFFYRAHDPKALEQWYRDHLGIPLTPQTLTDPVWQQQAGQTLVSAFSEGTKYFGSDLSKQWMINFRVGNLARLVAQLQAAGIAVKVDDTTYPNGRFDKRRQGKSRIATLSVPSTDYRPVGSKFQRASPCFSCNCRKPTERSRSVRLYDNLQFVVGETLQIHMAMVTQRIHICEAQHQQHPPRL